MVRHSSLWTLPEVVRLHGTSHIMYTVRLMEVQCIPLNVLRLIILTVLHIALLVYNVFYGIISLMVPVHCTTAAGAMYYFACIVSIWYLQFALLVLVQVPCIVLHVLCLYGTFNLHYCCRCRCHVVSYMCCILWYLHVALLLPVQAPCILLHVMCTLNSGVAAKILSIISMHRWNLPGSTKS